MKVKSLKELRKYIEKSIDDSLQNEVFETVKETELKHIAEDVFSKYSPEIYIRRKSSGLDDPDNIIYKPVKTGVLKIENVTEFNPYVIKFDPKGNVDTTSQNQGTGLVKLIEYGHGTSGYFYEYAGYDTEGNPASYMEPRPFIANTKEEIKETKSHIKSIKLGLKRNKIKTL